MTATPEATNRPILLLVSDRPFVWVGFQAQHREVRRWVGEREADAARAGETTFVGDPADARTYAWTRDAHDITAVVDLQDLARAQGAVEALRQSRPETAVLLITGDDPPEIPEIAISRTVAWTDALRNLLEREVQKLEALRRLHELRKFADDDGIVPILTHPDPDPDALASALAVRALLRKQPDDAPIITLGEMTRPENRRMAELLRMRVTTVTQEEVARLHKVIAVDFQPKFKTGDAPRLAVLDHHPRELDSAEFKDIRPRYGATATMLTEYLRLEDERRIGEPLATALLYGIKTDTDSLARGSSVADVDAYAFLQRCADLPLLRRLERPSYSLDTARRYGEALRHLVSHEDLALVYLGEIAQDDAHVLPDVADFCLSLEEITWAIASAVIDDKLVMNIRNLGGEKGAGDLARALAQEGGSGGGHAAMARAALELNGVWGEVRQLDVDAGSECLLDVVVEKLDALLSRQSSRPAHRAPARSAAHS